MAYLEGFMSEGQDENTLLARERTHLARERNRLANERTFLAWIRTGLASVGGGLAIIRFLTFQHLSHQITAQIVGSILVGLGIAIFFLSLFDYKRTCESLKLESGCASSVRVMSVISFILIGISFALLIIAFRHGQVVA
jgi:putative membrane protein